MLFNIKKETNIMDVQLPDWAELLFEPKRFKGMEGGRAGAKSHTVGRVLIKMMMMNPDLKIISIREHAVSTADSTKELFASVIREFNLTNSFKITREGIFKKNGVGKIVFKGMKDHNAGAVKSMEGFDIAWVEEAQQLSAKSLEFLIPTMRKKGAEVWFTWNPYLATDAVQKHFELRHKYPDKFFHVHVNYYDNPFLDESSYDDAMMMLENDPVRYRNVWLGEVMEITEDQIYSDKFKIGVLNPNEREWKGPYHGLDFGFAKDPMAGVKLWITPDNYLYVEQEAGDIGIELDDASDYLLERIPTMADYAVRADSSNPQNISYLKRHGLNRIEGVDKWPKSIEEGISFIRTFKGIIVHPDCKQVQFEMVNYKYKTDKASGDILPEAKDEHNHYCDAIRYALAPLIKNNGVFMDYDKLM